MATQNPHKISKMDTSLTATGAIRDDLDFPHAGLFRAMGQYAKGCFAIKAALTDFDITFDIDSGFSRVSVAAGKVFVHNKYVAVSAVANVPLNTSYADGGGGTNADLTPLSGTYAYLMIVYDADAGAIKIRGSTNSGHNNSGVGKIPLFMNNNGDDKPNDVPIAILRQNNTADDDGHAAIAVQYLTTSLSENSVEIGFPTGSAPNKLYNQAMTISSDSDGDVTFENHADDKDIIFKVSDGGTPTEVFRISGDDGYIGIGGADTTPDAMLHLKSSVSSQPEVRLQNTTADAQEACIRFMKSAGSGGSSAVADGDDLGLIRFEGDDAAGNNTLYAYISAEVADASNGDEAGKVNHYIMQNGANSIYLQLAGYGGDNSRGHVTINPSSGDVDFIAESDNNANMLFVNAGKDAVGIGADPDDNSALTVEGAISRDEISAPTATADYGKIWTQTDNNLYFQDGSGVTRTVAHDASALLQGKHTIWVPASAMTVGVSGPSASVTSIDSGSVNTTIPVLDFDGGSSDEVATFQIAFPKSWNASTVTARFFWTNSNANAGNVVWGLQGVCVVNDAALNLAMTDTGETVQDANITTAGDMMVTTETSNITINGAADDGVCFFNVFRDASDTTNDTYASDARLIGVQVFYQINAGNDA